MEEPSITVVTTMTLGDAVVLGDAMVVESSRVDVGVLESVDCTTCVLEAAADDSLLCGVLVETGVLLETTLEGVEDGGVVDAGVDEGVEETMELDGVDDASVDVADEPLLVAAPVSEPNPPVTADTTPPSNPPSFVVSCRRRMFASNQFACATAEMIANTDSSRK